MRNIIIILLVSFVATSAPAHDRVQLTALEKRVQQLEEQVTELAASTGPAVAKITAEQRADTQRMKARERMRNDRSMYSREELREIETLYQVANKQWRSEEGKASLKTLIQKFDKANRTGCALLYLGQMSQGRDKEEYLQRAIDGFSDCYYGNGVQVGAYARYHLAHYYMENGKKKQGDELFAEIAEEYPDAINHKGRPLADLMNN